MNNFKSDKINFHRRNRPLDPVRNKFLVLQKLISQLKLLTTFNHALTNALEHY